MRAVLLLLLVTGCGQQPQKIFHIADWHYVTREDFAADLKDQTDISDKEIERQYAEFLDSVQRVQNEQVMILRGLIRQHGIKAMFMEGVSDANVAKFRLAVEELPELDLPELNRQMTGTDDFTERAFLLVTIEGHQAKLMQLGAVGRLMRTGELKDVLPLEDHATWAAADPTKNEFLFDGKANENREREMAKRLKAGGAVVVVILGGGHDLADDLPGCRLEKIVPEAYRAAVEKH